MFTNDAESLSEQVINLVESEDALWLKRILQTGFLRGIDLLVLIFISVENPEDPTGDPKKIVGAWKTLVNDAIRRKQITPLDHHTFTPITSHEAKNRVWSLRLSDAIRFFDLHQQYLPHDLRELLAYLFKEHFPEEAAEALGSHKQDEKEANELEELKKEIRKLQDLLRKTQQERNNAAELFFGAIRHAFPGYDPVKINDYLSAMKEALENANVPRDTDTITKYLQIGHEQNSRRKTRAEPRET